MIGSHGQLHVIMSNKTNELLLIIDSHEREIEAQRAAIKELRIALDNQQKETAKYKSWWFNR